VAARQRGSKWLYLRDLGEIWPLVSTRVTR
jgi:hypothetical protein